MKRNWMIAAGALALAACNANDQDAGSAGSTADLGAQALDGPLAFARVYADLNNNHRLDAFEPRALTDAQGFVSRNPNSGENYCATAGRRQHCLRIGRGETAVIRVRGGYDTVTGEPFLGELALRTGAVGGTVLVSPITTLVAGGDSATTPALLAALQLTGADLGTHYFDDRNAVLLALSQRLHKIVSAIAAQLETVYSDFGEEEDLPRGLEGIVHEELAALLASSADLNSFLTVANLETLVRNAESRARDLLDNPPAALGAAQISRIARLALAMDRGASGIFRSAEITDNPARDARLRLMEVLLRKANRAATDADATALDDDVTWVTGDANADVRGALSSDTADLTRLVGQALNNQNGSALATAAARPTGASNLGAIAGQDLSLSFSDAETDAAVRIFFTGDSGARSGDLIACVRYEDKTDPDNSLNSDGLRLAGDWALVNDYSLALRLAFLGASRSAIVRSLDTSQFGFDFDGESRDYDGNAPSNTTIAVPATSEECAALLVP